VLIRPKLYWRERSQNPKEAAKTDKLPVTTQDHTRAEIRKLPMR
jgi:hypothetical protein